jgi:hypothetical protein
MTEAEAFLLVGVGLIFCLLDWRLGVSLSLIAGFMQDVLRKLLPGEPVYLTVLVGVFVIVTCIGAYRRGVPLNFKLIHAWNKSLRLPINLFIVLVLIQSGIAFIRTGSLIIAGIGLVAYLAPLPAILLGYRFSRSEFDIVKFAKVYLTISLLMICGVYLSYMGYDWDILRSVGEGLFIYSAAEGKLTLYSGFLRSPEIAAWHAATSTCLIILLLLIRRRSAIVLVAAGLVSLFLLGALLLTGRRKFLVEIILFIGIYAVFLTWFRKGTTKLAYAIIVMIVVGSFSYLYFVPKQVDSGVASYYQRGLSVQKDAAERLSVMTVDSFQYVIARNGYLGAGAGTGSQGAQYFGGGADLVGDAAEGGLAKVLAELGVPGLILLLWLAISLIRYLHSILKHVKSGDPTRARMTYGLLAFQAANTFVYVIAHQVFGDVFVLIILGFCLGFMLAVPRMSMAATAARPRYQILSQRLIKGEAASGVAPRQIAAQE